MYRVYVMHVMFCKVWFGLVCLHVVNTTDVLHVMHVLHGTHVTYARSVMCEMCVIYVMFVMFVPRVMVRFGLVCWLFACSGSMHYMDVMFVMNTLQRMK